MWVFGREDPLPRGIAGAPLTPGLEDWGPWGRNEESVEYELLGLQGWGRLAVPEKQEELLELGDSLTGGTWLSQIDQVELPRLHRCRDSGVARAAGDLSSAKHPHGCQYTHNI